MRGTDANLVFANMKTMNTLAARWSVRLGLSAATVAALAIAPAVTAAAAPATPSASFTWHTFKLLNGWKSASAPQLITGTPAWALHDGVIYLRGAITQPTPGGLALFAKLPPSARSASDLYIQTYTQAETPGTVFIDTQSGGMQAFNGNSFAFTSLAGISYPTAKIKSQKLTLKNGWKPGQSVFGTGSPSYGLSGGVVHLSGSLDSGKTGFSAFVLPKGARPSHQLYISVYTFQGSTGSLEIKPTGSVVLFGSGAKSFASLANVSFPVGAKWHTFKLQDGWKSGQASSNSGAPAYTIIDGVVYLTGAMVDPKGTIGLWTTLPAGVKTAKDVLEIEVYTVNSTAGGIAVTNSLGLVSENPFTNAQDFTSLAGVAYPQGS